MSGVRKAAKARKAKPTMVLGGPGKLPPLALECVDGQSVTLYGPCKVYGVIHVGSTDPRYFPGGISVDYNVPVTGTPLPKSWLRGRK